MALGWRTPPPLSCPPGKGNSEGSNVEESQNPGKKFSDQVEAMATLAAKIMVAQKKPAIGTQKETALITAPSRLDCRMIFAGTNRHIVRMNSVLRVDREPATTRLDGDTVSRWIRSKTPPQDQQF